VKPLKRYFCIAICKIPAGYFNIDNYYTEKPIGVLNILLRLGVIQVTRFTRSGLNYIT